MALIASMLAFVLKRAWHHRAILLPVVLGVLGVVTLLCSVPLFGAASSTSGLQDALHAPDFAVAHNLEIRVSGDALDASGYSTISAATTNQARANLGSALVNQAPLRRGLASMVPNLSVTPHAFPGQPLRSADFWFFSNLSETQVQITAGHLPAPTVSIQQTSQGRTYNVEAVIAPEWAAQYHIKLNDVLAFASGSDSSGSLLLVHFVGFFQPRSLRDPFWFDDLDPFSEPISFNDAPLPPMTIVMNEAAFTQTMPRLGQGNQTSYIWFYYLNLSAITTTNAPTVRSAIITLRNEFAPPDPGATPSITSSDVLSKLDEVIQDFEVRLIFVQIATLVAILPGLALLLMYLLTAASALAEHSREELALMKSRGASAWQMLALFLSETLLLCAAALLLAPLLAELITLLLIASGFFAAPADQAALVLGLPTLQTYLYASGGILICLLTLVVPAVGAVRATVLAVKDRLSRPRLPSLPLRVGPGVVLTALGVLGYVQIRQRGIVFTQNLQGGTIAIDWVGALAPTLLLLGIVGLGLLLIPPILALFDWIGQRLPGVAASLALRQMARRPAPYNRLILLLALTIALGLFTALFNGTFNSSFDDRAAYLAGADLRLDEGSGILPDYDRQAASVQDHLRFLPGVTDGMNAFRIKTTYPAAYLRFAQITTLAIDSQKFASLAYWRPDFANTSLASMLHALQEPVSQADSIPAMVDDQVLQDTGKHIGDEIDTEVGFNNGINFVIVGVYHYFPTLDTSQDTLVCDLSRF